MASEPSEALPVIRATRANSTEQHSATTGNTTHEPPPAVATPLPPRKRRVNGSTWPTVAAAQQATPSVRPPTRRPSPVANAPLPASAANTTRPARRPATRYTLVAPGFPDPALVGSRPRRPATRCADGTVPKR